MNWLLHITGIDTQQSYYYDFWSGIGPVLIGQLPLLVTVIVFLIHHNCHVKRCWRIGHIDPDHGFPACKKHHTNSHLHGEERKNASFN